MNITTHMMRGIGTACGSTQTMVTVTTAPQLVSCPSCNEGE